MSKELPYPIRLAVWRDCYHYLRVLEGSSDKAENYIKTSIIWDKVECARAERRETLGEESDRILMDLLDSLTGLLMIEKG